MKTGQVKTIPNMFLLSAQRPRFFALMLVFCILLNNIYPRAIIELKNYDVVVLAMGSQSVFLHLFALPGKVSVELANLLFNDKSQALGNKATNNNHKPKAATNSSSDFSILVLEQRQIQKVFELGAAYAGNLGLQFNGSFSPERLKVSGLFGSQMILYFVFLMLFYSRPRGDTANANINPNINNTKPGLNLKPGFLFLASNGLTSEVLS